MRGALVIGLALLLPACGPGRMASASAGPAPASVPPGAPVVPDETAPRVDFASQILPILETRCRPCHFPGGKMYEQLPFDSEKTIREVGEELFTRIKDPESQSMIRAFLVQQDG